MSNTPLNVEVPLEIFTAQEIRSTITKAHIVLHDSQHMVRQEGGRVRGREVAIR